MIINAKIVRFLMAVLFREFVVGFISSTDFSSPYIKQAFCLGLNLNVGLFQCEGRRAVEAVGANLAFGQANGLDEVLELGKFEAAEVEAACYLAYHALIFGRVGLGIFLQSFLRGVGTLKLLNDASGDEFAVALG